MAMSRYKNYTPPGPKFYIRRGVVIGSAIVGAFVSKKRALGALIGGSLGLLGVYVQKEYEIAQLRKMFGSCVDRTYELDNREECAEVFRAQKDTRMSN